MTIDGTLTTPRARRLPGGRRTAALLASLALVAGLAAVGLGGTTAGATSPSWNTPTLNSDVDGGFNNGPSEDPGADYFPVQYTLDGEGFVHLRGAIAATDAPVARPGGSAGPFVGAAFTLPCGYAPAHRVVQTIAAGNNEVTTNYEGVLMIESNGTVSVGGFQLPIVQDGTDVRATFVASLEAMTFEADPAHPLAECSEATTTTTE